MLTGWRGRRLAAGAVLVLGLAASCSSSSEPETAVEASARPATTAATSPPPSRSTTPATDAPTADGWVRHDDPSGISVEHPADWEVRPGAAGPLFLFMDPPSDVPFRRNVNIMRQAGNPSMTLEEYTELSLRQLDDIEGSSRSEVRSIRLSGTPAQRVEYRADLGSGDLRFLAAWTMRGGDAWLVTYSSDPERFEAGKTDVERVLRSLRLPD